eukprot:4605178-Heterocapsa_arctica.AAC.1
MFGQLFGTSSLPPLKSSQTANNLYTNSELEKPILSLKHTRSTDLFGTALQTCLERSEHKSVRNARKFGTMFGANT